MDKYVFDYMLKKENKRLDQWAVVTTPGEVLREHDAPYYYFSKEIRKELGRHVLGGRLFAVRVTIEPIDIALKDLAAQDFDA